MKHISIIVPLGQSVIDTVIGPYNLFLMANAFAKKSGNDDLRYRIDLVAPSLEEVVYQRLFTVKPTASLEDIQKTDLIIVAAIDGNFQREIERNASYLSWIKDQRIRNGAEVASLCKGAFLLAETGLLNGKSCSTHWTAHSAFRQRYPKVNLVPEKIITEDNGIYSSGGAYSFLNFLLFLIEKYYGREIAIQCSKVSEIEFDRLDQSPFMIFSGQKEHDDPEILEAQLFIENNFEDSISMQGLAERVNLSGRSFLRRFKKATANTPVEYLQRVKVEAAKKKLESTALQIQEVMYDIGYSDEKAFRNTFKKYSGLSPLEYRRKYNREIALCGV